MAVISDEINLRGLRFGVEPRDTLVFGQIYYNFLLNDEGMRRLTTDIMSSRVLTREIIEDNARMTIRHFDEDGGDRAFEASILSTGGTYDLLFRSICSEDCLDADEFAVINVAAFLAIYSGIPFDDSVRSLRDDLLEKNEVEEVVAAVMKAILAA